MNEEYLDELLNSGADPNKTEDNMLDMVEQAKKAAADDNAGRANGDVELNDEDKELLGADKLMIFRTSLMPGLPTVICRDCLIWRMQPKMTSLQKHMKTVYQ